MKKIELYCDDCIEVIMLNGVAMEMRDGKCFQSFSQGYIDMRPIKQGKVSKIDYVVEGTIGVDGNIVLKTHENGDESNERN